MGEMNDIFIKIEEMDRDQREQLRVYAYSKVISDLMIQPEIAVSVVSKRFEMVECWNIDESVLDYTENEIDRMVATIEDFIRKECSDVDCNSALISYKYQMIMNGLCYNPVFASAMVAMEYELVDLFKCPRSIMDQVKEECDFMLQILRDMYWNNFDQLFPVADD